SVGEGVGERRARAAALAPGDPALVGQRADDLDPEPALLELVGGRRARARAGLEARARVADLDRETVGLELVNDVDAAAVLAVGVLDGVRAGLGQRELEVVERLVP